MDNLVAATISAALDDLYQRAEARPPTAERCITPLNALLGAYNLTCAELRRLSSRAASEWLRQRGALLDPLDDGSEEPLAGFLYADRRNGAIFVEQGDRVTRRRFSIAHELGHYVLHFRPLLLGLVADDVAPGVTDAMLRHDADDPTPVELPIGRLVASTDVGQLPSFEQMEHEANQFAVELLMPFPVLLALCERYRQTFRDEDLVWRLATDLLVSRATMRWRLSSLGLFRAPTAAI